MFTVCTMLTLIRMIYQGSICSQHVRDVMETAGPSSRESARLSRSFCVNHRKTELRCFESVAVSFLEKTFKWLFTKGQITYQTYKTNSYSVIKEICWNVFILTDSHLLPVVNSIFPLLSVFFYCEESKQTLVLIWNVHISRIYHPNIKTCKTQLFVNGGILPVLAYKPLEWKSQVMFWGICCSALWLEFWPHHTITDFEIAPPQLFQWQWSELFWCAHARFSSDRWSGLLICDNMLRGLLWGDMKSHFAN